MPKTEPLWTISQQTLTNEMNTLLDAVQRLQEALTDADFKQHILSQPPDDQQLFLNGVLNELKLIAAKSATLVEVLS